MKNVSDDFVDFYDDEFIWIDLWECFFSSVIKNPEQIKYTTVDTEEMLELMPNDIIYMWNKLKVERNIKMARSTDNIMKRIVDFKKATESIYYVAFNVTPQPREEIGRTLLQAYLNVISFREIKMAAGQSDIFCPDDNTIIETKIWRGTQYFNDGIMELEEYLLSQKYSSGFYVVFYNTIKKPTAIKNDRDIFKITTPRGTDICCVFINIKPISPSKKRCIKKMSTPHYD